DKEKKQAEEQMKQINQAYGVLGNKEKRQQYDRYGGKQDFFRVGGGFEGFTGASSIFDEILRNFADFDFGQRTEYRQSRTRFTSEPVAQQGEDLTFSLTLTQEEAKNGTRKKLSFSVARACANCHQSGVQTPDNIVKCPTCRGYGVVQTSYSIFLGNIRSQTTCPRCY
ncbi:8861_t:CDS:1, partial [Racocetra persica]